MLYHLFRLLVVVAVLSACGRTNNATHLSSSNSPLFDVNDVSILWPLPEKVEDFHLLPTPKDFDGLSNLNLSRLLMRVGAQEESTFTEWNPSAWHVVATRFDPCQKDQPTDTKCFVEFRLVLQPLESINEGVIITTKDNALHLIYRPGDEAGRDIARKLYELKMANGGSVTNGKPLFVHPIMEQQGLRGAFAEGMRELLKTYAKEQYLFEATAMVVVDLSDWRFARTLRNAYGELAPAPNPFVGTGIQTLFGTTHGGTHESEFNEIRPLPSSADNLAKMADSAVPEGGFFTMSGEEKEDLTAAALRIDNPLRHTPSTIDCVSCHMASRFLARTKSREFLFTEDQHPDRFPAPANMTMINLTNPNELNIAYAVRMFGYGFFQGGALPAVTQRVINDSARIADILNQELF